MAHSKSIRALSLRTAAIFAFAGRKKTAPAPTTATVSPGRTPPASRFSADMSRHAYYGTSERISRHYQEFAEEL